MPFYFLWHSHKTEYGDDEVKGLGVYSTEENAKQAIERLKEQPGFVKYPGGFLIQSPTLDETLWMEGFVPIRGDESIYYLPQSDGGTVIEAGAVSDIYVLWHEYETEALGEESRFIGVYSTEEKAQQALEQLIGKPGFSEYPDGFTITTPVWNKIQWPEGFITAAESLEPVRPLEFPEPNL